MSLEVLEKTNNEAEEKPEKKSKKSRKTRLLIKFFSYLAVFAVIGFVLFSDKIISADREDSLIYKIPIIGQIKHLVKSSDKTLKGESQDRINILLLGMGGGQHQGGYLTDTIILASLKISENKVSMLSIPRDLSIPVEGGTWTKINNINAFAEAKKADSGGLAISQALSDLLDIPIDYYVRVDFEGFVNIVNRLGGLEVEVDNTLSDFRYPISGQEENPNYEARFEHLYIEKGPASLDGTTALKFARSRHALGVEGSDFARAKRQQKIIQAAKDKLLDTDILLKPQVLAGIIIEMKDHLSTNIKTWEVVKLWKTFKDVNKDDIITKVLDNGPNGLLYQTINEAGAYVLLPNNGDFEEVKYLVKNIFENAPAESKKEVLVDNATIEVRNGTWINGLGNRMALDLEKYGFEVLRISNSTRKNFDKSTIYDLSFGEKINSLTVLKEKTNASVSFDIPEWLRKEIAEELTKEENPKQPDFILIIGQDADKTESGTENKQQ